MSKDRAAYRGFWARGIASTAILSLALAVRCAHARDSPVWDRVKACFDSNLPTLLQSGEPIETVFKAVRAICDDAIDDALNQTFLDIRASGSDPKTPSEDAAMVWYFRKRLDAALFAYAVKFEAVGGPTTLQF
jgi:hypothetical protein